MTSPSTRRLLKESADLHKNPSPYFTASPTSDSNLHDWHFTLVGPPSPSPYAKGLYHGRITFPAAYPLRPPSFRFLTPSARFEVNREICLSISGHHEETWQPAWGVRTALLAIRSEIFSGESKGQVGGMEGSEVLRREYAGLSRGWVCHECGGSNEERMREVWENCRMKGVEVDVEGEDEGGGDDGDTNKSDNKTREESEAREKRQDHDIQDSPAIPTIPNPELHSESRLEAEISSNSQSNTSDASQPSESAQRSTTTTISTPPSSSMPSTSVLPNSSPAVQANIRPRLTTTSPANSPWLDRAIICVTFALVIMILRRTIDPDDL